MVTNPVHCHLICRFDASGAVIQTGLPGPPPVVDARAVTTAAAVLEPNSGNTRGYV